MDQSTDSLSDPHNVSQKYVYKLLATAKSNFNNNDYDYYNTFLTLFQ